MKKLLFLEKYNYFNLRRFYPDRIKPFLGKVPVRWAVADMDENYRILYEGKPSFQATELINNRPSHTHLLMEFDQLGVHLVVSMRFGAYYVGASNILAYPFSKYHPGLDAREYLNSFKRGGEQIGGIR